MQNVESVYPLTGMQQGILLRVLRHPQAGEYVEQVSWTLEGDFDAPAFERAWGLVTERHPVLRTAFFWEGLDRPLQVVRRAAALPVEELDWRGLGGAEREERLARFLADDRARGFRLSAAPLMRLTRIRLPGSASHFVWTHHHLLLDGWSAALCLRDVFTFYEALCRGDAARPGRAPSFERYVEWSARQDPAAGEAFWRGALAGLPGAEAPGVARAGAREGERYGVAGATLEAELVERLGAAARRHQLTLNTLFQGAWGALLAAYTGEDDLAFGSVVAGRNVPLPGVDAVPGVFVNTVPVRVRARPGETAAELLRALQAEQLRARDHEHWPAERLREWSGLPRGRRLFDTLFVFQNLPDVGVQFAEVAGVRVRDFRRASPTEGLGYALVLEVVPAEGMELRLAYDEARFDAASAGRLLGHLRTLLEALSGNLEIPAAELPLLPPAERARVVEEWSGAGAEIPVEAPLHRLFERRAETSPDAVAVSSAERSLTYGELDRRADRLARALAALGVGPEVPVALCLERSEEMVVAVLGVLKAGGAYVPLDPAYPAGRLAYVLADCRAPVLVTQAGLAERLPEFGGETVLVDGTLLGPDPGRANEFAATTAQSPPSRTDGNDDEALPEHAAVLPSPLAGEGSGEGGTRGAPVPTHAEASPDHLAYVIYTSGSTGQPKGVQVTHANAVRLFRATEDRFGFGERDVWTLFHSYAFDFSVWEMWGALLYGGRLVVVPFETSRDPAAFRALLGREGVTVLSQTPSAFRQLAAADERAGDGSGLALRWVVFGGEALEPASLRSWVARHGDERPRLVNMYGITETTVHVTHRLFGREEVEGGAASPIGVPIADLRVYVLGRAGEPVPAGVPGEMYVGGAGVARGYLGRPDLTAERFVPDPFSARPGARLYRSGDRARWTDAGELEYLGRADLQVKVRGFRVEPGEVEAALLAHPGVREAVVVAREERLVGYVVPREGEAPPSELRAHLRARLPEHMVPAAVVALDALPLTPNGKLDRRALPTPESAGAEEAYVPPRTPTEAVLAGIWTEVLGVERVGAHSGFFDLGGHSLLAMRVASRVHEATGAELPMRAVFEAPTLEELAAEVDARLRAEGGTQAPPLVAGAAGRAAPALLRAAAALVPGPHGARLLRLQRPRRPARARRPGRGGAAPRPGGGGAPPRGAAHRLPLHRGRARAGGPRPGPLPPADRRPRRRRGGDAPPGARGGRAPLRPGGGAAPPGYAAAPGGARLRPPLHDAPRRLRRLVRRRPRPRGLRPLPRRSPRASPRRSRSCRSSTPTSPPGSAATSRATSSGRSSTTGASAWPAHPPCWSSRSTTPAPPGSARAAPPSPSTSPPNARAPCASWRAAREPPSS